MTSHSLLHFVTQFVDLRLLVVGEAVLDGYLRGPSDRLCREAPVPIVDVVSETLAPGGAANTTVNAHSLGAHVDYLSVVGDDENGRRLEETLRHKGVERGNLVREPERHTLAKKRVIAGKQLVVRFDQGSTQPIGRATEERLLARLDSLFVKADAVIVSDYGCGVMTERVRRRLARLQRATPRLLVLDARQPDLYRQIGVTAVKPNYREAVRLLKVHPEEEAEARIAQIARHEEAILGATGAQIAAVTMDQAGALIFEKGRSPYRTYARPRPDSRAAGAGDTYTASLTLALAAGAHTPVAAEIAAAAASIVVGKTGTNTCSASELIGYLAGEEKVITDLETFRGQLSFYRRQGRRIVFTNGCFDIIHRGHITYLSQAKALGDLLIVGLNDDDSVRRLKGPSRPINNLDDRAQVLAAMSCIDHIVPFSEDTPARLLALIRPDILAKGGDYTPETLPEAPLVRRQGGEIRILPYLEDFSTTGIIERIRERELAALGENGDGGGDAGDQVSREHPAP